MKGFVIIANQIGIQTPNQRNNTMKRFFRRLTWGFLPKGYNRLLFVLTPIIIVLVYRVLDYIDYQDLLKRVSTDERFIGSIGPFSKVRPFQVDDVEEALLISTVISFVTSWIVDGFRNTERK